MISKVVLDKNVRVTIEGISVQIAHASNVRGKARTGYYKVAILLAASIVEALLFYFLEKKESENPNFFESESIKITKPIHRLPNTELGSTMDLWIAKKEKVPFQIKNATFMAMNRFCEEQKILNKRLVASLEYTRKKRNEIHLQTLNSTQQQFNAQILERISNTILLLYRKIES